mgnify:CR=1 FL=1
MDKNFELSELSNEELLELYKKSEEYMAFLEKEKKLKGTDEKWVIY